MGKGGIGDQPFLKAPASNESIESHNQFLYRRGKRRPMELQQRFQIPMDYGCII